MEIKNRTINKLNEQNEYMSEFRLELYKQFKDIIQNYRETGKINNLKFTFSAKINNENRKILLKEIIDRFPDVIYNDTLYIAFRRITENNFVINAQEYTIKLI